MDWMSRGACQREDPEIFFPITANGPALEQINAAKRICLCCAVRAACLSFGLKTSQDGIWGGTTREERSAIRRRPAGFAAQMSRLGGRTGS
jgi:WhiB family redox-sensing transcriptional regulator